jgi:acetylornithine/N-succinyldiaminopimelate aminotransferase
LIQTGREYFSANYYPREMILDHGKGARVWDLDGNDYVDLGAGIAVCSLGHQDPDLLEAMETQMRKLWHTSNIFFTEPAIKLSEALVKYSGFAKRAYLCNSGAEANEAAIKTIRKYAADKGRPPEAREIITFKGSFHGRTLATVTATAQPKYHVGYETPARRLRLLPGIQQ